MTQLILHLIGDYVTQSDWMAVNKTKADFPAFCHALVYSLPFIWLATSANDPVLAWTTILVTHFFIDRFRLARYVVWAKNFIGPRRRHELIAETIDRLRNLGTISRDHVFRPGELDTVLAENKATWTGNPPWDMCKSTGYPPDRPEWLCVWLLIIADNTMHLAINYAALRWF
jgi:hypothetical protein